MLYFVTCCCFLTFCLSFTTSYSLYFATFHCIFHISLYFTTFRLILPLVAVSSPFFSMFHHFMFAVFCHFLLYFVTFCCFSPLFAAFCHFSLYFATFPCISPLFAVYRHISYFRRLKYKKWRNTAKSGEI